MAKGRALEYLSSQQMFEIAIPSYKRVDTLYKKTLHFLATAGIQSDMITIFVADEEQHALYKAAFSTLKIVVGVPGIGAQRAFMEAYYPLGTRVLFIDDDLRSIKTPYTNMPFQSLIERCFQIAEKEGCSLWGFHPNDHGLSLRNQAVVGLRYIIGVLYGMVIGAPYEYPRATNEDWTRSMGAYQRDGKVLRFNGIGIATVPYSEGGLSEYRATGVQEAEMEATAAAYPDLCVVRRREGKPTDLRLKLLTQKRIDAPFS